MSDGSKKRMRKALEAIRDYPSGGRRTTEDGYPMEISYDEWSYRRMVDAYRGAARYGLDGASS